MRSVAERHRSLPWYRGAVFATIAVSAVSCSSDTARFDNPFSSKSSPAVTGTATQSPRTVQSRPLPPPSQVQAPGTTIAGGQKGIVPYQPAPPRSDITGSVPVAPPATRPAAPPPQVAKTNWTWEGGTPVEVKPGETAQTLSQRHGVPVAAIIKANNLPDAAAIKPGQRLVIPRPEGQLTTGSVTPPRPQPPVAAPTPAPARQVLTKREPLVHVVTPGETLSKISRQYKKSVSEIAKANKIPPHTMVKMGDRLIIPGHFAAPGPVASVQPQPQKSAQAPVPAPAPIPAQPKVVTPAPPPTAHTITPTVEQPKDKGPVATATAMPRFRWPVHGRVIANFGSKSGQQNDGINVAVPEGTPIKAAEDGVVAYAGNELKTYGNLVLIRHANGFVTAYAHASEILVKRDEHIKRGQIIAKSGQTGNVSAPQLHFEIRKGSSPVDPMPYLEKGST